MTHGRGDYKKPFNRLKKRLGLPEHFHWHDLRHSYCTSMVQNEVNINQLSITMGHYSELFPLNIYTDMDFIICNGFPEFDMFIDEVMPTLNTNAIKDATIDFDLIESVIRHS